MRRELPLFHPSTEERILVHIDIAPDIDRRYHPHLLKYIEAHPDLFFDLNPGSRSDKPFELPYNQQRYGYGRPRRNKMRIVQE